MHTLQKPLTLMKTGQVQQLRLHIRPFMMSDYDRLPIIDEANMLSRKIWGLLPHTADADEIKRQFSGLLSAHIDTYDLSENKNINQDEQLKRYWAFLVRAGDLFTVSSEDIRNIRAYVNYEIDHIDARMPDNSEDKYYMLYGLINIVLINGLPPQSALDIPALELNMCHHFAKIAGFPKEAVASLVNERIQLENELLK